MGRALLVPNQHVANMVLMENSIVNRQYRPARISENRIHSLILQGFNDHFCAGHFFQHRCAPSRLALVWQIPGNKKGPLGGLCSAPVAGGGVYPRPVSGAAVTIRMRCKTRSSAKTWRKW